MEIEPCDPITETPASAACDRRETEHERASSLDADTVERDMVDRLKRLPTSIGLILMGAGVLGVLLPGPIGTPLVIAGGLALAPKTFGRFEGVFRTRWPSLHRKGMYVLRRFLDDFEKRYPPGPGD